jgi:hypothetical protein
MRKNTFEVLAAFIAGERCVKGSVSTDGVIIRSYDMPIAQRGEAGILVVAGVVPSRTTASHARQVRDGLSTHGYTFETVKEIPHRVEIRF